MANVIIFDLNVLISVKRCNKKRKEDNILFCSKRAKIKIYDFIKGNSVTIIIVDDVNNDDDYGH